MDSLKLHGVSSPLCIQRLLKNLGFFYKALFLRTNLISCECSGSNLILLGIPALKYPSKVHKEVFVSPVNATRRLGFYRNEKQSS